ncbi:MAG: CDP-glycerol glycerophosphotransferase family protein [Parachlamydiales bacterium]|nr:CDP-glycerol glycerophosphotransferase family protein [Parachlamydiales bacterium]
MNACALIYGNNKHYIDHLAPLCFFLKIPIVTNEWEISEIIKNFYPNVHCIYIDNSKFNFYLVKNFKKIISCTTKDLFDIDFRFHQDCLNKEIEIIWCPHGNSDKGKTTFFMEALKDQKTALVYGEKMIDFLKDKNVFHTIKKVHRIGNYRYKYFLENKKFYKKVIKNYIQLNPLQKTILYAPTWDDSENLSSFNKDFEKTFDPVSNCYNIIVKLHPNMVITNEIEIENLIQKNKKKNILFLNDFTPIYALLDFVDIYVGDMSSVGYDFLTFFKKPMFFLKSKSSKKIFSDLFECGKAAQNNLIFKNFKFFLKSDHIYHKKRRNLYTYTFDNVLNFDKIL